MYDFDYIPIDQKVIDSYVNEFEQNRKMVLSKVRFDNGFEDSIIALKFMDELLIWSSSKVNVAHVAYNVAYDYLEHYYDHMSDEQFREILGVVNRWSKAFKCAYDHSSSVNFSWAMRELLNDVNPLIERLAG